MNTPSIRQLKETSPDQAVQSANPQQTELLQDVFASKGINPHAIQVLASHGVAGQLIDTYFMGNKDGYPWPERKLAKKAGRNWDKMVLTAAEGMVKGVAGTYTGTPEENKAIIQGNYGTIDEHGRKGYGMRDYRRNGANRIFKSGLVEVNEADGKLGSTFAPVAIVGGGPAGVLTGRALRSAGFRNVTIFDNTGRVGGIWNRSQVVLGTKNNPFTIRYDDKEMLSPGKDQQTAMRPPNWDGISETGRDVQMFVERIQRNHIEAYGGMKPNPRLRVKRAHVTHIEPGDLNHTLTMVNEGHESTQEFPIVIYAPGNGEALPPSRPDHMRTETPREAGRRWQQQLSKEELKELVSQKIVLVGLGNSTAEMLFQFQKFEDQEGVQIDYTVLTHHSRAALEQPTANIDDEPLFRDLSKPNLTRLAGDLNHIKALYWRAMHQGKIMSDVTEWHKQDNSCNVVQADGTRIALEADKMFTLIGYRQNPDKLRKQGITVLDEYSGEGAYDYDGEVQQNPGAEGRERLHPGYFAIGSIMKTAYNPNAMVIPGIQYQLNDLLPSVSLRAAEYALKPESRAVINRFKRAYYAHIIGRQAFLLKESFAAPMSGRSPNSVPPRY